MPGAVLSNTGDSFGKAVRSLLENSIPHSSTKARGGAEPMRAMIRSHGMRNSPSRVVSVMKPGSIEWVSLSVRIISLPAS